MATRVWRDDVQRLVREEDARLVEVLSEEEYEEQHIAGAVNIPVNELDSETTAALEKDRPVVVY